MRCWPRMLRRDLRFSRRPRDGAPSSGRRSGTVRWRRHCRDAGYRVLVNAASAEDAVGRRVVETSGGAATLVPCSVGQMIALVRRAGVVIARRHRPAASGGGTGEAGGRTVRADDPARNGPYGTAVACVAARLEPDRSLAASGDGDGAAADHGAMRSLRRRLSCCAPDRIR